MPPIEVPRTHTPLYGYGGTSLPTTAPHNTDDEYIQGYFLDSKDFEHAEFGISSDSDEDCRGGLLVDVGITKAHSAAVYNAGSDLRSRREEKKEKEKERWKEKEERREKDGWKEKEERRKKRDDTREERRAKTKERVKRKKERDERIKQERSPVRSSLHLEIGVLHSSSETSHLGGRLSGPNTTTSEADLDMSNKYQEIDLYQYATEADSEAAPEHSHHAREQHVDKSTHTSPKKLATINEEMANFSNFSEASSTPDAGEEHIVQLIQSSQVLVNIVLRSLCRWLDAKVTADSAARLGVEYTRSGGPVSETGSVPPAQSSSISSRTSGTEYRRHKRDRNDQNEESDNDDHTDRKRPRGNSSIEADEDLPRFACPFFKRNPRKYGRATACPGPGWYEVRRVKEHLYRRHRHPPQCPRCWEPFSTETLRDTHLQQNPPCETRENNRLLEGFTKTQEKQLRSRKRSEKNMTEADRWREMYLILFPDDNLSTIPSPYQDELPPYPTYAPGSYTDFVSFSRREFPTFARRELEQFFQTSVQDIETELRLRLEEFLFKVQARFLAFYEGAITEEQPAVHVDSQVSSVVQGPASEPQMLETPGLPQQILASSSARRDLGSFSDASQLTHGDLNTSNELFGFNFDWETNFGDMFNEFSTSHQTMPPRAAVPANQPVNATFSM